MRLRAAGAFALVASALLTGCAGADQSGTPAEQMTTWVKGTSFGLTVRTMQQDAARAATVVSSGTPAEVRTACGVYLVDVEQANSVLPTPDTQASALLAQAYGSLGAAAHSCYAVPSSATARATFAHQQASGLASLSEGTARVEAVLGRPLSKVGGNTEGASSAGGATGATP